MNAYASNNKIAGSKKFYGQLCKSKLNNVYQNMDSPPRPVPRGSPVCMIKSLWNNVEHI